MKERRDSWTPQELLDKVVKLDRDEYKVDEILDETYLDLDQIVDFLEETQKFDAKHDDKLQKLIRLLNSKDLEKRKVLIFSEFSDTAQYIAKHLGEAGIEGLEQLDSSSGKNRADVIRRFSPYYNGSSSEELAASRDTDATCDGFETAPQALHLRRAPDRPRREVERLGDPLGEGSSTASAARCHSSTRRSLTNSSKSSPTSTAKASSSAGASTIRLSPP